MHADYWHDEAERNRRLAGRPTLEQWIAKLETAVFGAPAIRALQDGPNQVVIWPDDADPLGR